MKEDIKILESIVKVHNKFLKGCKKETISDKEIQAIEHLIKAYKELEEENQQLETIKDEAIRRYNFESIPVSLVEEKIEELEVFDCVDEFDEQEVEVNRYEINRLIRAVKQLNREIKELKERVV